MNLEFKIGKRIQTVSVGEEDIIAVLEPRDIPAGAETKSEEELVREALLNPVGSKRLKDIIGPDEKIVIVTSDVTRPMPTYKVMPALLDELYAGGAKPENITLVVALGIHRAQTEEELRSIAGERAYSEISVVNSTPDDTVHLGYTKAGTPVDFSRIVVEADRRICLGNIEFHYFAGYSGGGKALMPGVSTRAAIQNNHSMMVDDRACAGNIKDNPVRDDIEEAAAALGIDFILNVVLDAHKNIVCAVAGDSVKAHREGCRFLEELYLSPIPERADIVIVSQAGAPKDLNLYQTQKALDNSKHAIKDGGIIILVGACQEGFGEDTFEEWLTQAESPKQIIDRLSEHFVLGGHKAAAIAMVMQHADIYLVSDMDPEIVKSIFMTPFSTVQEAYDAAKRKLQKKASVIAMPYGGSTLPRVKET